MKPRSLTSRSFVLLVVLALSLVVACSSQAGAPTSEKATKPVESKPVESKTTEAKAPTKPVETKPAAKVSEAKPAAPKPTQLQKVKFAYPSRSMTMLFLVIADQQGFFKDEGLEVELVQMPAASSIPAQVNGDIQYSTTGMSAATAAARGMPLQVISFFVKTSADSLLAQKKYNSIADLKGKVFGIDRAGSTADVLTRLLAQQNGWDPQKDIQILSVGDDVTRIQTLLAEKIDASLLTAPANFILLDQGLKSLLDIPASGLTWPMGGMVVTQDLLKGNRDQVKRVLRASVRGVNFIKDNKSETAQVMTNWLNMKPEIAARALDFALPTYEFTGLPNDKILKDAMAIQQRLADLKDPIPVEKVTDFSVLKEVLNEVPRK